jgi:hypothetical protein
MFVGQRVGWTHEEKALLFVPAIETRSPAIQFMTEFLYVLGYPDCYGRLTDQIYKKKCLLQRVNSRCVSPHNGAQVYFCDEQCLI